MNNGQARLADTGTDKERAELIAELQNFVCEGQYADGLIRIVDSFLHHIGGTNQPAAWVSGFYGSGKSHLLKMLGHLWANTEFPELGSNARNLVQHIPNELKAALKELDIQAKRAGGLHAAMGALPSDRTGSVRLNVLSILFKSVGLPEKLAQARFCLYLKRNDFFDSVREYVESKKPDFYRELNDLWVSPILREALLKCDPKMGSHDQVREALRKQFDQPVDISTDEFLSLAREVLTREGGLPITVIVLDEVQLFIGESNDRAKEVVELAEALCKQLDSRLMLVGAGQNALGAQTAQFVKLRDRFTISVELTDTDVEAVTRKVILAKKPDKVSAVKEKLNSCAGEISRQLSSTSIAARSSDDRFLVDDYPILPVRRRFWEHVARGVDATGTTGLLRAQLRMIHDALQECAELPVGSVVPADFMFDQLQTNLVQQGVLLRELDERIRGLKDGTPEGELAARICGLVFLIRKLPTEGGNDIGVRARAEILADLLIKDLASEGPELRRQVSLTLDRLVEEGVLLKDADEYNLQTRDSLEWEQEYRGRHQQFMGSDHILQQEFEKLLRTAVQQELRPVRIQQGECKVSREIEVKFGTERPDPSTGAIPLWVRHGWETSEKEVLELARGEGTGSPIVFLFISKSSAEELRKHLLVNKSADSVLQFKGVPASNEGEEARRAMETRRDTAKTQIDRIIAEAVRAARVFKGGAVEIFGNDVTDRVREGAEAACHRLFPRFIDADHKKWPEAFRRAKDGDEAPFEVIGYRGPLEQHAVCAEVLRRVGVGTEGRRLRADLEKPEFGWPIDAVDAAVVSLVASGKLIAREGTRQMAAAELDHTKLSKVTLRCETIALSTEQKLRLRGLFAALGVTANPSDSLEQKAGIVLERLESLIDLSGGEAPLPPQYDRSTIDALKALSGNELLAKMLELEEALKKLSEESSSLKTRRETRAPTWRILEQFLAFGAALSGLEAEREQVRGIRDSRLLLESTDHVLPLCRRVAQILRTELKGRIDVFQLTLKKFREEFGKSELAERLGQERVVEILRKHGVVEDFSPAIESDDELLAALQNTGLGGWTDRLHALPARFEQIRRESAEILEPKVQHVRLSSETLRCEQDVRQWISSKEEELLRKLKSGPVIVG